MLKSSMYKIMIFDTDFTTNVVKLLHPLWGEDLNTNLSLFKWKYYDNIHTGHPLGIVALYKGDVVGFRGYFATRFQIHNKNDNLVILFPGDTCVNPDHQRQGLSVAMGNLAMEEYALRCQLFFNATCNKSSLPGYLKMGFVPLAPKVYQTRCPLMSFIRYVPIAQKSIPFSESEIEFGTYGHMEVSHQPKPKEMAAVVAANCKTDGRIQLYQDEAFFR